MTHEQAGSWQAVILMGVSGCGKTTIGQLLAQQLGWEFIESDDYHSAENIRKMARGVPLTDEDRQPWLESLHNVLHNFSAQERPVVMACSALRENYRNILADDLPGILFVYLKGSYALIEARLAARPAHFMKAGMLRSQFETLQEPEDALALDIAQSPAEICRQITQHMKKI